MASPFIKGDRRGILYAENAETAEGLRAPRETLRSPNADLDQILPVRTLKNHLVCTSPWIGSAELHDIQAGKDIVIKEAAEPTRVPAAHGQGIARLVTCAARTLDGDDLG
jgi:hypothetical protein